jgi:hypothetical protein
VRFSAVLSSTGMGLPSAVEETKLVDDGFGWKGSLNETGTELRELSVPARGECDAADAEESCCLDRRPELLDEDMAKTPSQAGSSTMYG